MRVKLSGKALVIQLTRDNIRIAKMQLGGKARMLGCALLDTPAGAVEDGVIHDMEALVKVIKAAVSRPEFEGAKRVVFSLCTTQLISERVTVPAARGEKLDRIMDANMDVFFPVAVSDYQVTRQELGRSRDANGRKNIVMQLWAIPTELLTPYYALAAACGLNVAAVDYYGSSFARAVGASFEEAGREETGKPAEVYLMAEAELLLMTFVQDGRVRMQRSLLCGNDIDSALGEAMMVLDYYRSLDDDGSSPAEAIICGGMAEDVQFVERVGRALNIPVRVAEGSEGPGWLICMGAAQTQLDFGSPTLGGRRDRKKELGTAWHYAAVLVGGAAAIFALAVYMGSKTLWDSELAAMRDTEMALRIQSVQSGKAAEEYREYEAAYTALESDRANVLAALSAYSDNLEPVFDEINALLPGGAVVENMEIYTDGIGMKVSCTHKEKAAQLITAMRDMKYADVGSVFDLIDDEGDRIYFSVELVYTQKLLEEGGETGGVEGIELPEKLEVDR